MKHLFFPRNNVTIQSFCIYVIGFYKNIQKTLTYSTKPGKSTWCGKNKENKIKTYRKYKKPKINCNWRFKSRLVEILFAYKIKGLLRRFVDVMYSITEFKRKAVVLSVKLLSPCSNKRVNMSSFMDRKLELIQSRDKFSESSQCIVAKYFC